MKRARGLLVLLAAVSLEAAARDAVVPAASHASAPVPIDPNGYGGVKARETFDKEISRILQAHCQSCHHAGDIAPFPLMTYRDAYEHKDAIRTMTTTRQMPPWHMGDCATFENDARLSDAEIASISRWVSLGAPEGNAKDLPPPLSFPDDWKLGAPDLVVKMNEAFTPDLSHGDVYRCFVMPTGETEDHWVSGVEVKPGSRPMVHHVLLFTDTGTSSTEKDAADPGPGYACFGGPGFDLTSGGGLGGWAPGARPETLPDGVGMFLPKGAKIVMQVHYSVKSGVMEPDVTSVGITYSKTPVKKRFRSLPLVNTKFKIPAGDPAYPVTASFSLIPVGVHLLSVTPHMHLLGQSMDVAVTKLSGASVCLAHVPEWDFNWQGSYFYKDAIAIGPGDSLSLRAVYDNSAANPENPNSPPKDVTWGERTYDEMCLAFVGFTVDYENLLTAPETASMTPADFGLTPDAR